MGLFGKKAQTEEPANNEAPAVDTAAKPKKKKKDTMSTILSESVVETVMEDVVKNKDFEFTKNGESLYAAMLLAADDIGGINKKANKDEAKGSIVEMINSGLIKTLITPELMEDEKLVIIPDAMTVKAMDEFSILRDAPYELVYIHSDGGIELTGRKITYKNVFDVINESITLSELIGEDDSDDDDLQPADEDDNDSDDDDMFNLPESEPDDEEPEQEEPEPEESVPEDYEDNPNFDDDLDGDMSFDDGPEDEPDGAEDMGGIDGPGLDGDLDDEPEREIEQMPDYENDFTPDESDANADNEQAYEEIPDELVNDAIRRKFYSDDLGLEATTEPFDAQFMHGSKHIPFNENRGKGWLNDYLNEESRKFNLEMTRIHNENLFQMREYYFRLISEHCDTIQRQLDSADPNTQFGELFIKLKANKQQAEDQLDDEVAKRRMKLEAKWDAQVKQVGQDAAREAIQKYRERLGRQHDEDIFNIAGQVQDEIEREYQNGIRQMNEDRKSEASKRLDYGINAALKEVSNLYSQMLENERQTYDKFSKQLQDYIDENRKNEVARINALAEEQRQQEKSDKVMADCEARIKTLTAEFDAKGKQLDEDLKRMERDTAKQIADKDNQIADREAACRNRITDYEQRCKDLQGQVDDLLSRYSQLDSLKDAQYASRIAELQNERKAMEDRCEHMEAAHKKSGVVNIFLVVAVAIATLAVGVIVGSYIGINKDDKDTAAKTQDNIAYQQNVPESVRDESSRAAEPAVEPETEAPTEAETEAPTEAETEAQTEAEEKSEDKSEAETKADESSKSAD